MNSTPFVSGQWIDGEWLPVDEAAALPVVNPATEQNIAFVSTGTKYHAEQAVRAAASAADRWADMAPAERGMLLQRVAQALEARATEIAATITSENGSPISMSSRAQVQLSLQMAYGFSDMVAHHEFSSWIGHSLVNRAPVGVAACITPWNMPLLLTIQKVFPALGAGCTVIHKPSELTPLHARLLADAFAEADLPTGVYNMVAGEGTVVGRALSGHLDVDLISLTGSTRAGKDVAVRAAPTLKRVHLELGGKNASLVLDDADLESAIANTIDQAMFNTGQACLQWSRLLVPQDKHDEAVQVASDAMTQYRVGDPTDPETDLGPLITDVARERVLGVMRQAEENHVVEVVRGGVAAQEPGKGWFMNPTLYANTDPWSTIAQQEVFGPVVCVIPYRDEDEALEIVNSTDYGLHGAVWSRDEVRAVSAARRIRSGVIDINGGPFNPLAPFGGMKDSGIGRECGLIGMEEFTETQSIQMPVNQPADVPVGPRLRPHVGFAS